MYSDPTTQQSSMNRPMTSSEVRYFSVDELPPNTAPKQVERIHDALLPGTALRSQDGSTTAEMLLAQERRT